MDLRKMSDTGILADGEYEEFENNEQFKIKGIATELGGLVQLTLENVDRPEHWKGLLIFEKNNNLKVGGSRFVTEELRVALRLAQNEEPWLITKP
jgi:hypothetical protein